MTGSWIILGAGIMAAFNPCGVAMLPGYIVRLLGEQNHSLKDGLWAGGVMTLGFFFVFSIGGIGAALFASLLGAIASWVAFFVGVSFVVAGFLMFFGKSLLQFHIRGPKAGSAKSNRTFFVYGIAYALGSLGCTFPLFSLLVLSSFASQGWIGGMMDFLLYAFGMGFMVTLLSLASTISQQLISTWMRKAAVWMNRFSAAITVGTGIYLMFYWWPYLTLK
ncbi:cytochrome c biogenesis CcdA family protein [Ferroacidibacillus organovorans]|uniref:Cytochrome C biogenesis protein transmembrane domain-containing protein n=1 Tax=Ferroacidibacillus organovorans TaxID=1765683 RepID=A0A853K9D8_9BACL|nr:cytochrome c biogenesis protein CcdA [Ferroacidibacillus organovorans]KYP79794.1 hypothetical protein AYJ22_13715 [Ferroacidibacillus organovorans]OAG93635.1 hypothetical protein AYW79_09780 [Ferroacidibacillus organovorans]